MSGGEYLALAYGVVFVFVLAYVAIIAAKLARLQRETREILEAVREREAPPRSVEPVNQEMSRTV
jgi:CcmD family protein